MDALLLSRIQFAITSCFHFLYPPISIGLGLMLVIMEGIYLKTKNPRYKEMTRFWVNIFALTFALGVATGLVQSFGFGTNWGRFSRFVGDVFGSALATEGVFAFFLEAGFLGVLLFGWDRVSPGFHYLANILVCLGAHFSAIWILVANSWMQTPAGYVIEETPLGPRAVITSFWEMVFNPSSVDRLIHVILGSWLTGAFFVISVAAFYLLKRQHELIAKLMMKLGLGVAAASLLLQLVSGHSSARIVGTYQPAKLAACEGLYQTVPATPISIGGWVDAAGQKTHAISIPSGLSLLMYGDLTTPVAGLDQVPPDEWPNVPVVFQTFHLMVGMWFLMVFVVALGIWHVRRNALETKRKLLWALVFAVAFPHIAQQAGWICAEVGRQPWAVWHLLRTADGVSTGITAGQVFGSITMFVAVYILLFALFVFLLDRKIKHGPEPEKDAELLYRDPYKLRG